MILFLDIDGVLHPGGTSVFDDGVVRWDAQGAFCWRPQLMAALTPFPAVNIVIASDWRFLCSDEELRERVLGRELASRFAGVTSSAHRRWTRAQEIVAAAQERGVEHYVALDDDASVYERQVAGDHRFIHCAPSSGLAAPAVLERLRRQLSAAVPGAT